MGKTSKAIIFIPARYESSRFPGKVLADLQGKYLAQRVYENMLDTGLEVAIVTGHGRIEKVLRKAGAKVISTEGAFINGTDRVGSAYKSLETKDDYSYVINVQADEPLLTGQLVLDLLAFHINCPRPSFDVTTIVRSRKGGEKDFHNPHVVKAQIGNGGECHDFFRTSKGDIELWHQHVGVYCYTASALSRYCSNAQKEQKRVRELEQLRGLECGLRYGAMVVPESVPLVGVDTLDSLMIVRRFMGDQ